jgi:hypothetical protein
MGILAFIFSLIQAAFYFILAIVVIICALAIIGLFGGIILAVAGGCYFIYLLAVSTL